jgi:lysophospholipase L1-like esterase
MKTIRFLFLIFGFFLFTHSISGQSITKVAIIGNSITEGSGLPQPSVYSYPAQLANMLTSDWQIGNFGVSGRTMLKKGDFPIWNEQKFKDALNFEPNIVVIMLGTNDSKYYNWAYKADFYKDYVSMIDTFSNLASKPEIYICLPLKVFSSLYDINDVVIHDEIIPIIKQIALDKNVKTIDCYTPTSDKPKLFSDGIHPNITGAHFVAEIFYTGLTGNPYHIVTDENMVVRKAFSSSVSLNGDNINKNPTAAIDGDMIASWTFKGLPAVLTIDLGEKQPIDQFELFFRNYKNKGIQYRIETSADSLEWTTSVDQTMRTDTISAFSLDKISSVETRYIRLTITGNSTGYSDLLEINEFKALKYHGFFHAPVISVDIAKTYNTFIYVVPTENVRYMSFLTYDKIAKSFNVSTMIKDPTAPFSDYFRASPLAPYFFKTNAYNNGVEVFSDTIKFQYVRPSTTGVNLIKKDDAQFRVYPNPSTDQIRIVANRNINEPVNIKIVNLKGELVQHIPLSGSIKQNEEISWNGRNSSGRKVTPGFYFIQIDGKTIHEKLKIILN